MKKYFLAAAMIAAVCVSANAKKEVQETVFGIKSGIITISSDMEMPDFSQFAGMGGGAMGGAMGGGAMGNFDFANFDMSDMVEIIYFDDYGRKTARVTKSGERVTRTVAIGDTTYTINETENTATAMPIFGGANGRGGRGGFGMGGFGGGMGGASIGTIGQIDWMNLDKKTIRRNKIKELGEETVAGVTCKKYTMSPANAMGMTSTTTLCVYEGVVLSTETLNDWSTTPITQTAVQFEPNADIPASTFGLPEGCKVEQMNFGGMGGFGGGMGGGMMF